ncbi:hypothetical protein PS15p_207060 [Mucor circinelloides]
MAYPQNKQAINPPWSTAAAAAPQQQPQQPQQQQQQQQQQQHQWQQYPPYTAPASHASADQQYAAYYQYQTPEQQAYYQQYYQHYNAGNTNPSGTDGAAQAYANYDYSQYPGYYGQQAYQQPAAATSPTHAAPPRPVAQHQYQQHPYYMHQHQRPPPPPPQSQQQRPPPPPPSSEPNKFTYQAPPVSNRPASKIPPWSKQPPPPPQQQQHQPPPPPPPVVQQTPPPAVATDTRTAEEKANEKKAMAVETWPPSLKQYVQDVFANCLSNKRDQAELQLRNLILEAHKAGTLLTTDWSEMDLPSACTRNPQKKKKKGKKIVSQPKPNKEQHKFSAEEEAKRLRRLRRFEEDAAQFRSENVSTPMQNMHIDGDVFNYTVVGTSQKLEKQYLRLTSAPDPATVRPLEVLKQTLALLKDKWKNEQNYTYICDQFKSMRQDLTVQRIQNEFTVQVYEIHARIALEKSDLGEYNQCQTQLKGLYTKGIKGNVMEFTAYRILYFLHTQNWADVNSTMADLTLEQKQNPFVQHALNVRSSLATANYHRFFHLYKTAPNMGGYLMDHFCERERVHSLIILCKSCRPDIPLAFIQQELAFDSIDQVLKFLGEQKANFLKANSSEALDARAAYAGLMESSKKYKKIDIKGQL